MKRSCLHGALSALVLLFAMIACVLPGQATQPASYLDPITIETAVAGTAQAAAGQTAAAQPTLPRTTGATIEPREDGTLKYLDPDAGFEMIFPAGWLAVRPNSEEFDAALAKQGAADPSLHDQMLSDLAHETEDHPHRLFIYVLRPDILKNVMLGYSKLTWDQEDTISIDSLTMGELVRGLESSGDIPGFRADTAQIHEELELKVMEIGGRWTLGAEEGTIPMYATLLFFKPGPNSGVRITFSFVEEYRTQISADVKFIMESIKPVEQ